MDPLSITAGCVALTATATKLADTITRFVRDVRAARADLDAVSRELGSLKLILLTLEDEFTDDGFKDVVEIPETLKKQIHDMIGNCQAVLLDIDRLLEDQKTSRIGEASRWTLTGKGDVKKLQYSLEAHRSVLDIALELVNVHTTKAIKKDTAAIVETTQEIKSDTEQILLEIERLREQLPKNDRNDFMLDRYLDQLTSYAETVVDHAELSSRGASPTFEVHELEDRPADASLATPSTAGDQLHELALNGETQKYAFNFGFQDNENVRYSVSMGSDARHHRDVVPASKPSDVPDNIPPDPPVPSRKSTDDIKQQAENAMEKQIEAKTGLRTRTVPRTDQSPPRALPPPGRQTKLGSPREAHAVKGEMGASSNPCELVAAPSTIANGASDLTDEEFLPSFGNTVPTHKEMFRGPKPCHYCTWTDSYAATFDSSIIEIMFKQFRPRFLNKKFKLAIFVSGYTGDLSKSRAWWDPTDMGKRHLQYLVQDVNFHVKPEDMVLVLHDHQRVKTQSTNLQQIGFRKDLPDKVLTTVVEALFVLEGWGKQKVIPYFEFCRHDSDNMAALRDQRQFASIIGADVTIFTTSIVNLQKHSGSINDILRKRHFSSLYPNGKTNHSQPAMYELKRGMLGRFKLERV